MFYYVKNGDMCFTMLKKWNMCFTMRKWGHVFYYVKMGTCVLICEKWDMCFTVFVHSVIFRNPQYYHTVVLDSQLCEKLCGS